MDTIWNVGLQAMEVLTIIFGVLGLSFSLLLLFSPLATRALSEKFSRYISVDEKFSVLDRDVPTESFFYSRPVLVGLALIAGSVFALFFFFFRLDAAGLADIFFTSQEHRVASEILFLVFSWVGKIACTLGLVLGVMLLAAPEKMRRLEKRVDVWFETQPLLEKLNRPRGEIDSLFFRHPYFFGLTGLSVSALLVILSLLNFLK